ncbi:MAG: M16 family metallopeptidase [bacterium]
MKKYAKLFSIIISFVLLTYIVWAEGDIAFRTLEDGMRVVVRENHASPIVAIDVWVNTGAINETDENSGISHFFEHMLFNGTPAHPSGDISYQIERVGGDLNAGTSYDFVHYYMEVASKDFDLAMELQADAIMHPSFEPSEIEKERGVILEEFRQGEDNPQRRLFNLFNSTAYTVHPYRRRVIGSREVIESIGRQAFLDYHKKYYIPNNMTLVIVGDVDGERAFSKAAEVFKDFQPGPLPDLSHPQEPPQESVRRRTEEMDVKLTYLMLGYRAPGAADMEDVYAMDVLATILGTGRSSRLNVEIKERRQLVSTISAFYVTQRDPGTLNIMAALEPGREEEVERAILEEIARVKSAPASPEELRKAKTLIKTSYAFANETNIDQASGLGFHDIVAGDYRLALTYPDEIEKVSAEDVLRVANKYLKDDAYTIVTIVPKGETDKGGDR